MNGCGARLLNIKWQGSWQRKGSGERRTGREKTPKKQPQKRRLESRQLSKHITENESGS